MFLVLDELSRSYRGESLAPPVELTLADYLADHVELVRPTVPDSRLAAVVAQLPPPPKIWGRPLTEVVAPRFDRVETLVPAAQWTQIRRWAASRRISSNAVVLAAYARAMGRWASTDALTVNVTQFDRDPGVPSAAGIAGDFTRLFLAGIDDVAADFPVLVQTVQKAVIQGMSEPEYATTEVCRHLLASRGTPVEALFPIVFTSGLGLSPTGRADIEQHLLGRLERVRSQTPQVALDLQVTESSAGLRLTADFVTELFLANDVRGCLDELTATLRDCRVDDASPVADESGIAERVARAWSSTLGVPDVVSDTNFFTSGGDSLKATALMRRLTEDGVDGLSLRTLLENPRFGDFVDSMSPKSVTPAGSFATFEEGVL